MSSLILARGDVAVDDARQRVGEIGQLVIVRREDRLRPRALVRREVLGDRPREAEAVERRRAAADFVEDHEAARRRRVQDRRRLLHLDHERRLAARDVVGRADAGEDPIDDRRAWRVRAGTNDPACASTASSAVWRRYVDLPPMFGPVRITSWRVAAVERDVVRHERRRTTCRSTIGMPRIGRAELVAVVHVRLRVVARRPRSRPAPASTSSVATARAVSRMRGASRGDARRAAPRTARARARRCARRRRATLSS